MLKLALKQPCHSRVIQSSINYTSTLPTLDQAHHAITAVAASANELLSSNQYLLQVF